MLSCEPEQMQCALGKRNTTDSTRYIELTDGDNHFCPRLVLEGVTLRERITYNAQDCAIIHGDDALLSYNTLEQLLTRKLYDQRSGLFKDPANITLSKFASIVHSCQCDDGMRFQLTAASLIRPDITNGVATVLLKGFTVYSQHLETDFVLESLVSQEEYEQTQVSEASDDSAEEDETMDAVDADEDDDDVDPPIDTTGLEEINLSGIDIEQNENLVLANEDYDDQIEKMQLEHELQTYIQRFRQLQQLINPDAPRSDETVSP